LLYDEQGQRRLEFLDMDGPLIKSKIANGELTENKFLLIRKNLNNEIEELKLKRPLNDQAKTNLQSRGIQECIMVGLLTLTEAETLSDEERNAYELKCIQVAFAKQQVSKQELTPDVFRVLALPGVREAMDKKYVTTHQVIHYPNQVEFLTCNRFILDAVLKERIKKEDVFALKEKQLELLCLSWVVEVMWTPTEINPDAHFQSFFHVLGEALFFERVPLKSVLNRTKLLLEIEDMHGGFGDTVTGVYGVAGYLEYQWANKLTVQHCIYANPDVISSLLLSEKRYLLESLVHEGVCTVEDILKLDLKQIQILYQESVQHSLKSRNLKIQDIHRYTGMISVEQFLNSIEL
jgi:hypothetical protein